MAQEKPVDPQAADQVSEAVDHLMSVQRESVIKPLEDEQLEYDFWQDLRDSLPPWIDEVVGFVLFVFGILSFISLYFPSEALVAVTWADILQKLFGNGSVFVAATLFAFGILLWLPKAGIRVGFSSARMLALEIVFLSVLAMLHLSNSDAELRALARAGQGGGLVGWGISYPFYWVMGRQPALAFFALMIAISVVIFIGLRRRHIVAFLGNLSQQLRDYGQESGQSSDSALDQFGIGLYRRLATTPGYRTRIMRIRPDPENIPDELRKSRAATEKPELTPVQDIPAATEVATETDSPFDEPTDKSDETDAGAVVSESAAVDDINEVELQSAEDDKQAEIGGLAASDYDEGALPALELLSAIELLLPEEEEIEKNVSLIENTLLEFDIEIHVVDVQVGPTVTRYALQPHKADGSERIRLSKIASYSRDLSLALAAKRLRMETPVPGTNYMGIEVPNKQPSIVALRNIMASDSYRKAHVHSASALMIPLGRDVMGEPVPIDLTSMPHLLIAGTTGSGKSVCMAAIATSLLMQNTPDRLKMVMLDPKMVELARFNGIPHLLGPVETDNERIIGVLRWCTREMDRRYKLLEKHSARNIDIFNERQDECANPDGKLAYLVIMIDEIGDLMMRDPVETEACITRLAQMARAVGMHMVVATQRPSVDVITGLIKANFPSRIAFSVASGADSRVILDKTGAEQLLGKGDMLFLSSDAAGPQRVQGCFVSEDDVRAVLQHWQQWQAARFDADSGATANRAPWERTLKRRQFLTDTDPMLEEVIKLVVEAQEASASLIQRRLGLGYPRAARIMDLLDELDVVGDVVAGGRAREVIIPPVPDPFRFVLERHLKKQRDI
ncbi:MAG: DNA translocase FtsK [Chloroflexi bacterium]|nr:DNA translocase FtsK [Chloroflexota bacterium]